MDSHLGIEKGSSRLSINFRKKVKEKKARWVLYFWMRILKSQVLRVFPVPIRELYRGGGGFVGTVILIVILLFMIGTVKVKDSFPRFEGGILCVDSKVCPFFLVLEDYRILRRAKHLLNTGTD